MKSRSDQGAEVGEVPAKAGVTGDQVLRIRRTSAVGALAMGVVALVALGIAGYIQAGIGACLGLAFGAWMLNSLVRTALSVPEDQVQSAKKQFIASRMVRLGAITGGVLVLCFAARQVGLGSLGGLAAFYVVMLAVSARVVAQSLRGATGVPTPPGAGGSSASVPNGDPRPSIGELFGMGGED